jgi:5'-methylthioadenosine phosphorylase
MPNSQARIGIIGGTGLYDMEGLTNIESVEVDTPFGKPSDAVVLGSLSEVLVAFLPRHGRGHRLNPTGIPVRANIYALKSLGVERIISVSAVGSLKEELAPQDMVVPDQLIDRTRLRGSTFFDEGMVVHVTLAEPFCPAASQVLYQSAAELGVRAHLGGTLVVMEGPAFSTRAESLMYRSWGADIIGMTTLPEAKLAREAEICYTTMAWVTDYDCWRPEEEAVTADMILQNLSKNVATSKEVIHRVTPRLTGERRCSCVTALENAIVTPPATMSEHYRRKLGPIIGKYLG